MAKKKTGVVDDIFCSAEDLLAHEEELCVIPSTPSIDYRLGGGILEGSVVLIRSLAKVGKMQPLDSVVYTPTGPVKMGDTYVRQEICTENGSTCTITNIFNHENKDVYKVTFSDGTSTECGLEHLWQVSRNNRIKNSPTVTMSLQAILDEGLRYNDRFRFCVQLTEPVHFKADNSLEIHPYVLGCLLGDGSLTANSIVLTSADQQIIDNCNKFLDADYYFKQSSTDPICFRLNSNRNINKYKQYLINLDLMGKNSHDKFIPQKYLFNSIENRIYLLNGLLDTDGGVTINENGTSNIEYSTVSSQLAKDVQWLVQSLGGIATIKERYTSYDKEKYFKSYRLKIRFNDAKFAFLLSRKKNKIKPRTKGPLTKKIVSVEKTRTTNCRCIEVDSPTHLYLTDEFTVTHNTLTALEIARNALKQGRYVVFVDTEVRLTGKKYFIYNEFLSNPKFKLIKADIKVNGKTEFLSGEKIYSDIITMMKLPKYTGAVYIVDSISCVITKECIDDKEVRADRRDQTPKLNADFLKKMSPFLKMSKGVFVGIQHLQIDMSPTGHGRLKPIGGDRLEYASDIVLEAKHRPQDLEGNSISGGHAKGEDGNAGALVRWDLPYNRLLSPYCAKEKDEKILNYYRHGQGCWRSLELFSILYEIGYANVSGSWITFTTDKIDARVQGKEKAADIVEENLAYFEELVQKYYTETYKVKYDFTPSEDGDE